AVVEVVDVGRGRDDALVQRLHGEHRLDAAGAAEQVAGERLGRGDQRVRADRLGDRDRLHHVAGRGRGGVRVDVLDVVAGQAAVGEHAPDRLLHTLAARLRLGDVVGVGGVADTGGL